jgi:hypothetical protein
MVVQFVGKWTVAPEHPSPHTDSLHTNYSSHMAGTPLWQNSFSHSDSSRARPLPSTVNPFNTRSLQSPRPTKPRTLDPNEESWHHSRGTTVSRRPMLIHTCHAVPMLRSCPAVPWPWEFAFRTALSEYGMVAAWTWHSMRESNTVALCKSNGKTQYKPFAARNGRGTAWARHGMCELAFRL